MTTPFTEVPAKADDELVSACLAGDRTAFEQIIARYQSLVCSVAYSATGNLSLSEDLAQETFITAWQHLRDLREPLHIRAWLRGIARNLIGRTFRSQQREPSHRATPLDEITELPAAEPLPSERTISREEADILWRALERIPDIYREPLILYYREHQSVAAVAGSLEISDEAVRQRLARGRKLLHEEVTLFVEGALEKTSPGTAFTQAVVAALPPATVAAKLASLGAAAKGAGLKSLFTLSAWAGLFALVGAMIFQWKTAVDETKSPRERKFMLRVGWVQIPIFILTMIIALFLTPLYIHRPLAFSFMLLGLLAVNGIIGLIMMIHVPLRQSVIRAEEGIWDEPAFSESEEEFKRRAWNKAMKYTLTYAAVFIFSDICFPWKMHWSRCLAIVAFEIAIVAWSFHRWYKLFQLKIPLSPQPAKGFRNPLIRIPVILLAAGLGGGALGYLLPHLLTGQPFPKIQMVWVRDLGLAAVATVVLGLAPWLLSRTGLFRWLFSGLTQGLNPSSIIENLYGPFFQQPDFSPELREPLKALILKRTVAGTETGKAMIGCKNKAAKRDEVIAQLKRDTAQCDDETEKLLGHALFQSFTEFEKTVPDRTMLRSFNASPEKKEELIAIMSAARAAYPWSTDLSRRNREAAFDLAALNPATLEIFAREEEEFNRQLLPRIQPLLNPTQFAAFEKALQRRIKSHVSQHKLAAKLFGV